jgi:hypothetical protein
MPINVSDIRVPQTPDCLGFLGTYPKYPSQYKLFVYCALSDGAYSEGAFDELWRRLSDDPNGVVARLAECEYLTPEEKIRVAQQVSYSILAYAPWRVLADIIERAAGDSEEYAPGTLPIINAMQKLVTPYQSELEQYDGNK